MITVEEHRERILATVRTLPAVDMGLLDALGCALAEDVTAAISLPGFTNSAMDGYAVRSADVAAASESSPVVLPVGGDIPAGSTARLVLEPGQALRIMTGAPLPDGADAIVPVEETDSGTEAVSIRLAAEVGRHLRHVGEDVRAGAPLLSAGTRLGPGQVALLAAAGHGRVRAVPRPRVVVVSTGNELVEVGGVPGFGQIVDSNSLMLVAASRAAGAVPGQVSSVADDAAALESVLAAQLLRADALVTTGGVSMGAYDTVKEVLSKVGTMQFDRVAMRPGMPQGFGVLGERDVPVFTLPGNPVSALVSFHVFVLPALRAMAGLSVPPLAVSRAVAAHEWQSVAGKVEFARVVVADGRARLAGGQGSHMLGAMADANALAVVPAELAVVPAGQELDCLPLLGTGS